MIKVLITGVDGFLGSQMAYSANTRGYSVVGADLKPFHRFTSGFEAFDITSLAKARQAITKHQPKLIVHCAAIADVNLCERDKQLAHRINVQGTENIAKISNEVNAKMIYISTDQVFDGNLPSKEKYTEKSQPNPVNEYGRSKLEGERRAIKTANDLIIARTANLYGYNLGSSFEQGFAYETLQKLRKGGKVEVSSHFHQSPTQVLDFTDALFQLFERNNTGLFHVAGRDTANRVQFAIKLADYFGLDRKLIVASESGPIRNVALDVTAVETALNRNMLDLNQGLHHFKRFLDQLEKPT